MKLHQPASPFRLSPAWFIGVASFLFVCCLPLPALAQTGNVGSVSGRVFNPATGDYFRNAEISISGTALTAVSDDNGAFLLRKGERLS